MGSEPTDSQAEFAGASQSVIDNRDLAFVALKRARMPMAISDPRQPDNPIVLANTAFYDLTGYTPDEVVGRNCRFLQGPDTDRAVVDQLRAAIAEEREIEVELLNYKKDGSPFWNTIFVSPVHSETGELLYFFASQKDETARRRAMELEAVKHKLLKEIDHRAKNALALVQSVVRLTQRDDSEAFAASIEGRVEAIARAHRLLADANWNDIPLQVLFENESGSARGSRIALSGPPMNIAAAQVQPLSLLIHEVFDNAIKHGSLSVGTGRIDIVWRNDVGANHLTINISESGGPPPHASPTTGLGQRLIDRIVRHQLGGTATFDYGEAGLQSIVTVANSNGQAR